MLRPRTRRRQTSTAENPPPPPDELDVKLAELRRRDASSNVPPDVRRQAGRLLVRLLKSPDHAFEVDAADADAALLLVDLRLARVARAARRELLRVELQERRLKQ